MIVTPDEMRAIEEAAFRYGATPETLMDTVGASIADRIKHLVGNHPATVLFYAGKGNNAGDALVAAKVLREQTAAAGPEVRIALRMAFAGSQPLGELAGRKLLALPEAVFHRLTAAEAKALPSGNPGRLIVVDGLLGIGAAGRLREPILGAAREINALRQRHGAYVLAIDAPTGVDAASGAADEDAVVADETLTVGSTKAGLVADAAVNYVGKLFVLPLLEFTGARLAAPESVARGEAITAGTVGAFFMPRPHESNKGMFGRIGILAGSIGATGAAVMCSHACARAGAGLITLLTHPDVYPIVAGAASPEVMVKPLESMNEVLDMDFDVLGLGPGLGRANASQVRELVAHWKKPMVVDADGLNALSEDMSALERPAGPRLLTPHPGEMTRLLRGAKELAGLAEKKDVSRATVTREFTDRFPVTLLLKGARTLIAEHGRPSAYNTTGNPGMATGGMGDVLTGICCALAGQKLGLFDAATCAAWLHGQAADTAREAGQSEQSLLPMDVLEFLGTAFNEARRSVT